MSVSITFVTNKIALRLEIMIVCNFFKKFRKKKQTASNDYKYTTHVKTHKTVTLAHIK